MSERIRINLNEKINEDLKHLTHSFHFILYLTVKLPREGVLDSGLLKQIAMLGAEQAQKLAAVGYQYSPLTYRNHLADNVSDNVRPLSFYFRFS